MGFLKWCFWFCFKLVLVYILGVLLFVGVIDLVLIKGQILHPASPILVILKLFFGTILATILFKRWRD